MNIPQRFEHHLSVLVVLLGMDSKEELRKLVMKKSQDTTASAMDLSSWVASDIKSGRKTKQQAMDYLQGKVA